MMCESICLFMNYIKINKAIIQQLLQDQWVHGLNPTFNFPHSCLLLVQREFHEFVWRKEQVPCSESLLAAAHMYALFTCVMLESEVCVK